MVHGCAWKHRRASDRGSHGTAVETTEGAVEMAVEMVEETVDGVE